VERRAREILEEFEDGSEHRFMVIPGQGRYQAIVEKGPKGIGLEMWLGRLCSLECEEPVYAIDGVEDIHYAHLFLKGERRREDQEPEALVRSLGCKMPWFDEPPRKPWKKTARTAALIQGLSKSKVLRVLEKEVGHPLPPGYYHFEETPQGLLLAEGTGSLVFSMNRLAHRYPRATIYEVIASPTLDFFVVFVKHDRKTLEFAPPPEEAAYYPALHEVMGERTPERILAALGMRKEWFLL
jgi:hypothetical protein